MNELLEIIIWGKKFNLPIEYDCYEGEEVTTDQLQAVLEFKSHTEWLKKSKINVEEYCRAQVINDDENTKRDNIFSYIKPEYLYVKREEGKPRVAIMCNYRYDMEHGLAIVFNHDGKVTVGIQDIIL